MKIRQIFKNFFSCEGCEVKNLEIKDLKSKINKLYGELKVKNNKIDIEDKDIKVKQKKKN
jgi:hypothetical protein